MKPVSESLHAIVHGLVQGVNFRYYAQLNAQALHLTGWVRNRPEGTVEVVAEGTRPALERLLAFLNEGPSHARVDCVDVEWLPASGRFSQFQVLH